MAGWEKKSRWKSIKFNSTQVGTWKVKSAIVKHDEASVVKHPNWSAQRAFFIFISSNINVSSDVFCFDAMLWKTIWVRPEADEKIAHRNYYHQSTGATTKKEHQIWPNDGIAERNSRGGLLKYISLLSFFFLQRFSVLHQTLVRSILPLIITGWTCQTKNINDIKLNKLTRQKNWPHFSQVPRPCIKNNFYQFSIANCHNSVPSDRNLSTPPILSAETHLVIHKFLQHSRNQPKIWRFVVRAHNSYEEDWLPLSQRESSSETFEFHPHQGAASSSFFCAIWRSGKRASTRNIRWKSLEQQEAEWSGWERATKKRNSNNGETTVNSTWLIVNGVEILWETGKWKKNPQHFILAHLKIHWETFVAFCVNSGLFLPPFFLSALSSFLWKEATKVGIDVCGHEKNRKEKSSDGGCRAKRRKG